MSACQRFPIWEKTQLRKRLGYIIAGIRSIAVHNRRKDAYASCVTVAKPQSSKLDAASMICATKWTFISANPVAEFQKILMAQKLENLLSSTMQSCIKNQ
jgi:hypothetical protein